MALTKTLPEVSTPEPVRRTAEAGTSLIQNHRDAWPITQGIYLMHHAILDLQYTLH